MNKNSLINGPVLKAIIYFALPLLLSNIFQQLYNTVDTVIVGNHLGEQSLAAIGASMAVFQLVVGFALGFGNGFGIVIARFYGGGDEDNVKRSVVASLYIGLLVISLVMLISTLYLKPLLNILRTPAEIVEIAYDYIHIITMFVGVTFAYNLLAGFLRAIGNSFMPLVFLILSALLNIILDILLVIQMDMGIQGAAIATVIAQSVSSIAVLVYILLKAKVLIPRKEHFVIKSSLIKDLAGQGSSMAMMSSFVIIGTVILQYAINDMGYLIIAGHTIARRLNSILLMPVIALVLTISTFVSQNKGANQGERILEGYKYIRRIVIVWGLFITVVTWMFSEVFIGAMSGSEDLILIKTGSDYLKFNAPFYGLLGVLLSTRFLLQGLGEKVKPLVSSIIELVMKFAFVIWIIPTLGYIGIIIIEPVIWIVMMTQLAVVYFRHPYIRGIKESKDIRINNRLGDERSI